MAKTSKTINKAEETIFRRLTNKLPLTRRRIIFIVILLAAVFGWRSIVARNATLVADTTTVSKSTLTETVSASGAVAAEEYATLTFQTVGEITNIYKKEGDIVNKGDLIAQLDTTQLQQAYLSSQASLRAAQAALDLAYDQVQGHDEDESFAQRNTRTQAEAAKDIAYRNFVAASKSLQNARIVAPFSGVLSDISDGATVGTTAGPTTVFTLVNPDTVYFRANVNEVDVPKVSVGAKTIIELDAFPDITIEETVEDISFTNTLTSTGSVAYVVKTGLPTSYSEKFRVGMSGDAEFILSSKENVLVIPVTSVVEEEGKMYVWKVDNKKVTKIEIQVGSSSVNSYELTGGLSEGDNIVTRPPKSIKEGQTIRQPK